MSNDTKTGNTTTPNAELSRYVIRLADDALIHGQRLTEWVGNAPSLEEELALANVALDYLGRARFLYAYCGQLIGKGEDELAFLRDAHEFENLLIAELPRGDFAFAMLRQYFLDVFEHLFFNELLNVADKELAAVAAKTLKEVQYHRRRSEHWLEVLCLGTAESRARLEAALAELWGYKDEFFLMDPLEQHLVESGVAVDRAALKAAWHDSVEQLFGQLALQVPESNWQVSGGREGVHTEHLGHLLGDMQFLQRAYPGLTW